ncbi:MULTISPECIES: phytanoyl-CoA dioxygenase family protein [unclassified Microbispora]|uniref:phytanoyl-CoA dioxygenase family protein n=1 Tax=unclassified Microbispora TaxID=2614687 RepID=UPI00147659F0|nr:MULTISPECIES: phytanoyl-CoA dioxygenase family protein [unclassified Microbispora]
MTIATGLSRDQVEAYRRDGFLFPLRAMSAEKAAEYRARMEAFESEHGERASGILRSKSHLVLTWVNELIRLDSVLDAVESVLGPDIYCWGSSFFIKNPHNPGFIAWHQDAPFSAIPPGGEILTAWIALAPSTLENGCLKVVAGTHKEQAEHVFVDNDSNMLSQGQEIAVEVDEADATAIQLLPGEFSLHHQFIFHGSGPSVSDERRIGLAVRYMRPFPRQDDEPVTATLVRGQDPYGTFENEPVPTTDMDPAAVAYLDEQLIRRHGDRYRKA